VVRVQMVREWKLVVQVQMVRQKLVRVQHVGQAPLLRAQQE
jgi:hypothetical protein